MQPLIWGYKFTREIARRMPHFRGEPPALHPAFMPGGPASVVAHAKGPIVFDTPRIVYSEEDERALEAFVRANGALLPLSSLHYLLTSLRFDVLGAVSTAFHSVSSPLYGAGRCRNLRVLARHMRDEAPRAGRRRRFEAERVRSARAQSRRPVNRTRECKREHVWDRSCHWGKGCHDYRGGAQDQNVVQPPGIVRHQDYQQ